MEETHVHALDYLSVFQRRKWWLLTPIVLSIIVGGLLVRYLPKEFRSSTTLGVDAPSVSPSLISQTPTLDNQERMREISQQLLSPPLLAQVAREEGMVAGSSIDAAVNKLRHSIDVTVPEPLALTNEPRRLDAFNVSYSDTDPERAQRVANRIAKDFVDENSKTRESHAQDTSAFISAQLAASQTRLTALDGELRRAKESHMGQLPEQTQANLQTLSGLRQQLGANATSLRAEQDRESMIERQIEGMNQGAPAFGPRGSSGGDVAVTPSARVNSIEHDLATARAMYTDKHPEVVRLQEDLAAARRDAAADRQKPASDRAAQLQLDPSYRQLMTDRDMARIRIRELERAEQDSQRQIAVYQARVEQAPMVEQQLTSVQRDYDLEKLQYSDLSSKLHSAQMAENVERNRDGEQFSVLYAASYPLEPTKPIPMRVMLIAILAGIVLGTALTLGREYFDRSVYDARDIRNEFELPVLGTVGHIQAV